MSSMEQVPAGEEPRAPEPAVAAEAVQGPSKFFEQTDWVVFWLSTGTVLVVYLRTLAPEVTLEDSGVLATGAFYAGVGCPPGFPLWTTYAWLFTVALPFSNVAWRVAVSSAVAGALACGLIALMATRGGALILEGFPSNKRLPAKDERWLRIVCGLVTGAGFGFDSAFWGNAVIVETWTLGILLFSIVLCLLLQWSHRPERKWCLYGAALVYGLTLTVAPDLTIAAPGLVLIVLFTNTALGRDLLFALALCLTAVLLAHAGEVLPGVLTDVTQIRGLETVFAIIASGAAGLSLILVIITRRLLTEWRKIYVVASMLFLGLSMYFYIALASMTNPPVNWGYPRTVEGFGHTLGRGQFERLHATPNLGLWMQQLIQFGSQTVHDFGWIYTMTATLPFCFMLKMRTRQRCWMLGLLATFLTLSLFMVAMLNPPPDSGAWGRVKNYFAASHLILALCSGCGLVILGTILGRKRTRNV